MLCILSIGFVWWEMPVSCCCVLFHMSVLLHLSTCSISLQRSEWEVAAQCVYQTGCVISFSKPTTQFCALASTPSMSSPGFGELSSNTHIHHCQRHKQLSISPNPQFCINMSFSCSSGSCAVIFFQLIKFDFVDWAQHGAAARNIRWDSKHFKDNEHVSLCLWSSVVYIISCAVEYI